MEFKKAVRKRAKLRLALSGPSGSGKTYGGLLIAKGLGGRIAVIDTEEGSASMYSHLCDFDSLELKPPYSPERFIEALRLAEKNNYDIVIIDSVTHEWSGSGGCLEINDRLAKAKYKGNTWSAWSETTPRHRAFIDAINQSPCHVIATMRSKVETAMEGRTVFKLGMKDEQRDGTEYEFTIVLNVIHDNHYAKASKDRTGLFKEPHIITPATGKLLMEWLNSGAAIEEPKKEVPSKPVVSTPSHSEQKKPESVAERLAAIIAWVEANAEKKKPADFIEMLATIDDRMMSLAEGYTHFNIHNSIEANFDGMPLGDLRQEQVAMATHYLLDELLSYEPKSESQRPPD